MSERKTFIRAVDESEKIQKREKLLRAAGELFMESGFQGTTVAAVTREAGESTGTFYLYFSGKVEIFRVLFQEAMLRFREHMDLQPADPDSRMEDRLREMTRLYLHFYREHRQDYLIMFGHFTGGRDFRDDRVLRDQLDEQGREILDAFRSRLSPAGPGGNHRDMIPREAVLALWALMDGIILINERNGWETYGSSVETLAETAVSLMGRGLRRHPD